jgi:hypothetical protein
MQYLEKPRKRKKIKFLHLLPQIFLEKTIKTCYKGE